jgi:site-specific DNA-methyltransferase (adenine-specific)
MVELSDKSIHLVITSPPYWQLKDYGADKQIGFNDSYEDYINNLNLVWKECYRVLDDGCRLCINIGDQFARSVYYGRYKVIPIRTEIIKFCESIGFDYMGAIIWQKKQLPIQQVGPVSWEVSLIPAMAFYLLITNLSCYSKNLASPNGPIRKLKNCQK